MESANANADRILAVVRRYWGYDTLRPLQHEAMQAALAQRDSLVVMPTGGGKSLCYQVPPAVTGRTDIVVSPLIALMKDQVDALSACGYPAAALHSGMDFDALQDARQRIATGRVHLVFVAPERLLTPRMLDLLGRVDVRAFAIDEAHCISHWGHDFRPEYRQLTQLKERFPQASVHAYTATATQRVRDDVVVQLGLQDPTVLIGTFDRPNLVYRVLPRRDAAAQTLEVIRRHAGQAGIVYCISRKDAESMAAALATRGIRAAHYHAGMSPDARRRTQDAFAAEQIDVIAATVAFGMGIDRSDVRCVVHAGMPKSIEHYQQETGRAGRDGLEAECVLLYSAADVIKWESLIESSAAAAEAPPETAAAARQLLEQMRRFATAASCRHARLSEYFGQSYPRDNCGACDVCLDEVEGVADGTVIAQKILSCVARAEQRFGVEHIADILLGAKTERIRNWGHDKLTTYGLLKDTPRKAVVNWTYQLLDAGLLARTNSDRPVLTLNDASWAVLRGQRTVRLIQPKADGVKTAPVDADSWAGVERGLFDHLRAWRRRVADGRGVPPFVIFADTTLRELARARPSSPGALLAVRGIGERKLADFGDELIREIRTYCDAHAIATDTAAGSPPRRTGAADRSPR
ncbi:DNA helicase RecQ [Candidatus Binatia bacterium]|nr:DNA helicase RecQ [Candidatus Binatia bacterium]